MLVCVTNWIKINVQFAIVAVTASWFNAENSSSKVICVSIIGDIGWYNEALRYVLTHLSVELFAQWTSLLSGKTTAALDLL